MRKCYTDGFNRIYHSIPKGALESHLGVYDLQSTLLTSCNNWIIWCLANEGVKHLFHRGCWGNLETTFQQISNSRYRSISSRRKTIIICCEKQMHITYKSSVYDISAVKLPKQRKKLSIHFVHVLHTNSFIYLSVYLFVYVSIFHFYYYISYLLLYHRPQSSWNNFDSNLNGNVTIILYRLEKTLQYH